MRYFKVSVEDMEKYIVSDVAHNRIKIFVILNIFMTLDLKSKQNIAAFLTHMEKSESVECAYEDRNMIMATAVDERVEEIESALLESDI